MGKYGKILGNPKERWEKYGKIRKYGENTGKVQEKREEDVGKI